VFVCLSLRWLCSGWLTSARTGPRYQRPAPQKYLDKYLSLPISDDTAHLYAMLEYIDFQVGIVDGNVCEDDAQAPSSALPPTYPVGCLVVHCSPADVVVLTCMN
jgi:hypothetical protein